MLLLCNIPWIILLIVFNVIIIEIFLRFFNNVIAPFYYTSILNKFTHSLSLVNLILNLHTFILLTNRQNCCVFFIQFLTFIFRIIFIEINLSSKISNHNFLIELIIWLLMMTIARYLRFDNFIFLIKIRLNKSSTLKPLILNIISVLLTYLIDLNWFYVTSAQS